MTLKSCKNQQAYEYNGASQRTKQTRTDASYVNYGYDNYGQVQTALGYTSGGTPITSEQYGYAYDAAWNLLRLTNNGSVTTRSYSSLNQLPSPPYGDYTYDANGNLTVIASRTFTYDDENQLVSVADTMYQKTAFTYDAKGRLRIRQEYSWVNSMWSLTDTINYVYDGMLAIQTRGASISSYTRGLDLGQSLQGAGGIGGLLAQSTPAHSYYHSDGNGNVTYLMKADQSLGASYRYDDAYGNVVTTSGTLANPFRFSSKEWLPRISAYYYGYRFYYPSIQRWLNRDPIAERGGVNLYAYIENNPANWIDPLGLKGAEDLCAKQDPDKTARKVLKQCNYSSKKENREYCGMICKDKRNGRIFKTGPITGTEDGCAPNSAPCPSDSTLVGVYHTHGEFTDKNGDGKDDYDSENFSPADRGYAGSLGVPIYLRTPSCQFKKYTPSTGNTTNMLP